MKKIAILISSPLSNKNPSYLPAAKIDIISFYNYLISDIGGRWDSSEIIPLHNPSSAELKTIWKEQSHHDFAFIVFSGHGSFDKSNNTDILQINDNEFFSYNSMKTLATRQVSILDTCRNIAGLSGINQSLQKAFNSKRNIYDYDVRQIYEQLIMQQNIGCCTLHSTQIGHYSYAIRYGSYFLSAILNEAKNWAENTVKPQTYLCMESIFKKAKKSLINTQIPEIDNPNLKFPFALSPLTAPPASLDYSSYFL